MTTVLLIVGAAAGVVLLVNIVALVVAGRLGGPR